jgi:hypothetical protein
MVRQAHMNAQLEEFATDPFCSEDADCPLPSLFLKATVSAEVLGVADMALDLYLQKSL